MPLQAKLHINSNVKENLSSLAVNSQISRNTNNNWMQSPDTNIPGGT